MGLHPRAARATWLDGLRSDVRYVCRSLASRKIIALAATLTFAIGIGANVALFSIIDRLLFRPFPYQRADRLVQVHMFVTGIDAPISAAMMPHEVIAALQQAVSSLEGWAYEGGWVDATVPAPGENPLLLTPVNPNALDVLRVQPVLGRGLSHEDEQSGNEITVVLAHDTWLNRFGGSADVIGRTWGGNIRRYCIVGVLPPGFFFPSSRLVEKSDGLSLLQRRIAAGRLTVAPIARLTNGATLEAAQAEVDLVVQRGTWQNASLRRSAAAGRLTVTLQPLRDGLTMIVGPYMWLASSAVWILLAIACVNLSTLLLMCGEWGRRDTAIRAAIGASPARLMRLQALDALALCLAGSCLAWLVYLWLAKWILAAVPPALRGLAATPYDGRLMGMTILAATVCALLAAAAPALAVRRLDLVALVQGGLGDRAGRRFLPGARVLLCAEAGLAAAIAVGAAVTVPDFVRHLLEPTGFRDRDVYTVTVNHDWPGGSSSPRMRAERYRTILEVVEALLNVQRASAALPPPFIHMPATSPFWQSRGVAGRQFAVAPGVFGTLETPLRAGREFSPSDDVDGVAMVNETGARILWPGMPLGSVPGRTVQAGTRLKTIVGVVRDIRSRPRAPRAADLFVPLLASDAEPLQSGLPVLVRMASRAVPDAGWLMARLNQRFPRNAVRIAAVSDQLAPFVVRPRFLALLFGGIAGVALVLVGAGVYAISSVESARRRREAAIRIALGASPGLARRAILLQVVLPVLMGTVVGLGAAHAFIRTYQPLIKELTAAGPVAYSAAAALVVAIAAAAVFSCLLRMSASDPWSELRSS